LVVLNARFNTHAVSQLTGKRHQNEKRRRHEPVMIQEVLEHSQVPRKIGPKLGALASKPNRRRARLEVGQRSWMQRQWPGGTEEWKFAKQGPRNLGPSTRRMGQLDFAYALTKPVNERNGETLFDRRDRHCWIERHKNQTEGHCYRQRA
jgi:hypothetical protein